MYDYIELFELFHRWKPELIEDMRGCLHSSENGLSPYHFEDDVYSHTCMVYRHFLNLVPENDPSAKFVSVAIAILCHDIGKIYTRKIKENGNVAFHGHSFASIQQTIDFIDYLVNEGYLKEETKEYITYISTTIVSNHIDFFREKVPHNKLKYCNYNYNLLFCSVLLSVCDDYGRINYNSDNGINCYERFVEFYHRVIYSIDEFYAPERHTLNNSVIFLCGLPGVGKSTYVKDKENVVSFDTIRLQIFKEKIGDSPKWTDSERYSFAFNYCNKAKIDLNSILVKQAKEILKKFNVVYIDNTNLTRKARRSLINSLGCDNYYKAIFIVDTYFNIMNRRYKRVDKFIPLEVMERMFNNIQMPTFKEGFNEVEVIWQA